VTPTEQIADQGSLFLGIVVCWLLNVVHLGIAYFMFVESERMLSSVFVLVGAVGLLQVGYIAPLWYLFRSRGKRRMARGLMIASTITLLVNGAFWLVIYING
jgi:hypothetical protein